MCDDVRIRFDARACQHCTCYSRAPYLIDIDAMTIPSISPTSPTSPKKQSLMPSSDLRRKLRGAGHSLRPLVLIGKDGTTPAVLKQLDVVLLDHELVKVKILAECPEDRLAVAAILAKQPKMFVAQVLGRTVLAYRKHPEHPAFEK